MYSKVIVNIEKKKVLLYLNKYRTYVIQLALEKALFK